MAAEKPTEILSVLHRAGYEACYVGGCVRDTLLGREIHDWDITTSALPQEILACFSHCIPTGIRHGTVTVLLEGTQAEVTTYRTEGSYGDGRHPDQVRFVRSLREDLSRRDFTVNAMAMDENGNITDPFGGCSDLENRILRCVGEPVLRFREDALRMFRALRFSAQLGFRLEEETRQAILQCASLSRNLSTERIRDEMEKTLLSDYPERLDDMASMGLLGDFLEPGGTSCRQISELPRERTVRWAGLCRCWPGLRLEALRLDRRTCHNAMAAAASKAPETALEWKSMIAEQGPELTQLVAALSGESAQVTGLLQSGQCLRLRDLAVTGADIPWLHGREVGEMLQYLLHHVLSNPEDNRKEILLEIAKSRIDYHF